MSRARRESFQALKKWVFDRNSQVKKIAAGQGIAGTRAAPSQSGSNDSKIGSRLDNGETFTKDGKEYKRYKWQINKNAENATLKDIASKDSHKVWAEADIPITSDNSKAKATVSQLFDDLEESMKWKERELAEGRGQSSSMETFVLAVWYLNLTIIVGLYVSILRYISPVEVVL